MCHKWIYLRTRFLCVVYFYKQILHYYAIRFSLQSNGIDYNIQQRRVFEHFGNVAYRTQLWNWFLINNYLRENPAILNHVYRV